MTVCVLCGILIFVLGSILDVTHESIEGLPLYFPAAGRLVKVKNTGLLCHQPENRENEALSIFGK